MALLKITEEERKNLDLKVLAKVVKRAHEDVQIAVNTTRVDHRFPQGMLVVLGELNKILGETS